MLLIVAVSLTKIAFAVWCDMPMTAPARQATAPPAASASLIMV
jgi:hypothetical protein